MTNDREHRDIDPRLHAYLDGELSASETAAFEEDLRSGNVSANHLKLLTHLGAWFQATRLRAPSSLAESVERAVEFDREPDRAAASTTPASTWWRQLWVRPRRGWVWVPAAAAAAAVVVLSVVTTVRDDSPPTSVPGQIASDEPGENTVRYVFTVEAGQANRVCLAGDFNEWKVCNAPFERVGESTWSITIDLPRGRHEYMFVIDDQWVVDPNAMGYSNDGFGNRNSVLVV
jgi:hypothetical protein